MIQTFIYIAIFCLLLLMSIYGLYFLLVIKTSKIKEYLEFIEGACRNSLNIQELPKVSILVPAHNEDNVISEKLRNIAAFTYPREKLEVILIDDCSTDNTAVTAARIMKESSLTVKILRNSKRIGVNASYNRGITETTGDYVLMTDADVVIEPDALMKGVRILKSLGKIGGVTGRMITLSSSNTAAVSIESSYRSFFDQMAIAESAIDSTYPGYTCLALVRKAILSPLKEGYGSSDGNLSLSIIAQGYRYIYVPQLAFYESIATKIREQRRQKIRRGTRLLQSTLMYSKNLFNNGRKEFTKLIFPLRLSMMTICPICFWVGLVSLCIGIWTLSQVLMLFFLGLFFTLVFLSIKLPYRGLNLLSSFVVHQFYLISAIIMSPKRAKTWKAIERNANASTADRKNIPRSQLQASA